jgi:uracil-DNA glycosylase
LIGAGLAEGDTRQAGRRRDWCCRISEAVKCCAARNKPTGSRDMQPVPGRELAAMNNHRILALGRIAHDAALMALAGTIERQPPTARATSWKGLRLFDSILLPL